MVAAVHVKVEAGAPVGTLRLGLGHPHKPNRPAEGPSLGRIWVDWQRPVPGDSFSSGPNFAGREERTYRESVRVISPIRNGQGSMQNKLMLIGIVLIAAGLGMLAYFDPIVRVLVFGSSFTSGGASGGTRTFSGGNFTSGSFTSGSFAGARSSFAGGGANELIETFSAFGASVIGLILVVAATLARRGSSSFQAPEKKTGQ